MLLSDDEYVELCRRALAHDGLNWALREAVRLTAERCAEICEEVYLGRDNDHAGVCAAAIREQIKDKPGWFDPNSHGRGGI